MAGQLTLSKLKFRAGASPGNPPLEIAPPTVTVLVGPNGSGKSRALSDIDTWAQGTDGPKLIIEEMEVEWPTYDEARELLRPYEVPASAMPTNPPPSGAFRLMPPGILGGTQLDVYDDQLRQALGRPLPREDHYDALRRRYLLGSFKARLTGRERHALANDQPLGDLQRPQSHLAVLFADDALRARVSSLVYDAFGLHFTLDPTSQVGQVRIRLNASKPPNPDIERALNTASVTYHSQGLLLAEQSDGVQAYTGLVSGIFSLPHRLILIDEPETFLPPPLARRLGRAVAEVGRERSASVVAATHSAAFLMGCAESSADTAIVRLTYERATNHASARVLPTSDLRPLMAEPLLRSTRALDGLFHRAVIVGEADADRAFYDEINRRLVDVNRGVPDAQFVNAQNWSTEARIIRPLRRLGVPAAGILDLDTLWNPKGEWRALYRAIGLSDTDAEFLRIEGLRQKCTSDRSVRATAKTKGVSGLPSSLRTPLRQLIKELAAYGIFIVPVGELEQWLPKLGVKAQGKHQWIVRTLNRLGSDPSRKTYIAPTKGDVWSFLDGVEVWVANPRRLGMP